MELHKEWAPDVPCLMYQSQCLPWNGIQINVDHLSNPHSDYSDTENTPSANFYLGVDMEMRLHKDPKNDPGAFQKMVASDGGMGLMDSLCVHSVHAMDDDKAGFESIDGHGRHLSNRCSLVFMATRQTVPCVSTQFISEALRAQNLSDEGVGGTRRYEVDILKKLKMFKSKNCFTVVSMH